MAAEARKTGLGRGLGALLPGAGAGTGAGDPAGQGELLRVRVDEVFPNPDQPRRRFSQTAMNELADSIREKGGVLQPIIVQRVAGGFQLVAGERRWRACRIAGLTKIEAIVRRVPREEALEDALIENIQRENLDALEEAGAYREMMERRGLTQEQVAKKVGKDRATVANALRLLSLPEFAREELVKGNINAGHARALLSLPSAREMKQALARIVSRGLSVREAEGIAARARRGREKGTGRAAAPRDPEIAAVEKRLERHFGTAVRVRAGRKGGRIEIAYHGLEELNGLLDRIFGRK
jgi:ParB family chromosome partitioning protein